MCVLRGGCGGSVMPSVAPPAWKIVARNCVALYTTYISLNSRQRHRSWKFNEHVLLYLLLKRKINVFRRRSNWAHDTSLEDDMNASPAGIPTSVPAQWQPLDLVDSGT